MRSLPKYDPGVYGFTSTVLTPGAEVSRPKFAFTSQLELPTTSEALGVHDAFDPTRADFNGIAPNAGLYISDIIHDATITVDEQGTKAAAATADAIGTAGKTGGGLLDVRADGPFIYLINDDTTGAILFIGRTLNPTKN